MKTIEYDAFLDCSNLARVSNLPDTCTYLSGASFSFCYSLCEFSFPSKLLNIDGFVFNNCPIKEITLPSTLKSIGWYAFSGNNIVEKVTIPQSVSIINEQLFSYCGNLKNITLEKGIKTINQAAFMACSSLEHIIIPEGVSGLIGNVFDGCLQLKTINLPVSLKNIGGRCFNNCENIGEILIVGNTTIGDEAFNGCKGLRKVIFSDKVETISNTAFYICENLEIFDMDEKNEKYISKDGVLYSKSENILVAYPPGNSTKRFMIPESVDTISYLAFFGSRKLKHLKIPIGVTNIFYNAFEKCDSLECGSVEYDRNTQYDKLIDAKMKTEALEKCPPTSLFTSLSSHMFSPKNNIYSLVFIFFHLF